MFGCYIVKTEGGDFTIVTEDGFSEMYSVIEEKERKVKAKETAAIGKPNSVSKELIESKIESVEYVTTTVFGKKFMHCYIKMKSGFVQVGKPSVCVDDANFNLDDGKSISYENSFEELWKLEGYLMVNDLSEPGDFKERLKLEQQDLQSKINKLKVFLDGEGRKLLPAVELTALKEQLASMTEYNATLIGRISRLCK